MRATNRRGFTLIELVVSIVCATMLLGMVSMAMRISVQARNQRSDQDQVINEGREAMDTIERLVSRAVELQEWDASTNTPSISDATSEGGDSYRVSVAGSQNLGSGNTPFAAGDIITHDGTRWSVKLRNPTASWDAETNTPNMTPPTGALGDTRRVTGTAPPTGPWISGGPVQGDPAAGWRAGDIITKRAGPPGPPSGRWTAAMYRPLTNEPPLTDASGAVGDVWTINIPRPVPAPPLVPLWTPTFTKDFGSGPIHLTTGDVIVKGPFGWRKLGYQNAVKNFKNSTTGRDDDVSGIQFFADVDPPSPAGFFAADCSPAFPQNAQRKILEWVWIWWDHAVDSDLPNQPYDRRGPLKVAIFRAFPSGNVGNEHDTWTRSSHPLFNLITKPTQARRAYHTTAGNFGTLQMKVQTYASPVDRSCQVITWAKRVAVTGGLFLDRTGELAAMGTNPWDDVAPGSRFLTGSGAQARFTNVPSYTFCRSIYVSNAGATADDQNRPFTFDPNVPNNNNRMRRASVGWQTRYTAGNVKNDHVVQPR